MGSEWRRKRKVDLRKEKPDKGQRDRSVGSPESWSVSILLIKRLKGKKNPKRLVVYDTTWYYQKCGIIKNIEFVSYLITDRVSSISHLRSFH